MSVKRRTYDVDIIVNDILIKKVVIDPHYEEKHAESINDEIILGLAQRLNNNLFEPDDVKSPYEYYVTDKLELGGKYYKLIWLLEENEIYLGVINAYRRS